MKKTVMNGAVAVVLFLTVLSFILPLAHAEDTGASGFAGPVVNVWASLGSAWDRIGLHDAYIHNKLAARFVDALITFLLVFMFVYEIMTKGKRKFSKPVGIGMGLLLWLPLVIFLNNLEVPLLVHPYPVFAGLILFTAIGYRAFMKMVESFGGPESAKLLRWKIVGLTLSMAFFYSFMWSWLEWSIQQSGNNPALRSAMMWYSLGASLAGIALFITLIISVIGAAKGKSSIGSKDRIISSDLASDARERKKEEEEEKSLDKWEKKIGGLEKKLRGVEGDILSRVRKTTDESKDALTKLDAHLKAMKEYVAKVYTKLTALRNTWGAKPLTPEQSEYLETLATQYENILSQDIAAAVAIGEKIDEDHKDLTWVSQADDELMQALLEKDAQGREMLQYADLLDAEKPKITDVEREIVDVFTKKTQVFRLKNGEEINLFQIYKPITTMLAGNGKNSLIEQIRVLSDNYTRYIGFVLSQLRLYSRLHETVSSSQKLDAEFKTKIDHLKQFSNELKQQLETAKNELGQAIRSVNPASHQSGQVGIDAAAKWSDELLKSIDDIYVALGKKQELQKECNKLNQQLETMDPQYGLVQRIYETQEQLRGIEIVAAFFGTVQASIETLINDLKSNGVDGAQQSIKNLINLINRERQQFNTYVSQLEKYPELQIFSTSLRAWFENLTHPETGLGALIKSADLKTLRTEMSAAESMARSGR